MCGIVALLLGSIHQKDHQTFDLLVKSLRALQNRGYDSCGLLDSQFRTLLRAVKKTEMEELQDSINPNLPDDAIDQILLNRHKFPSNATVGIAHTRWATSGKKLLRNAHPHLSHDNTLAVIHNGIIENYQVIKEELEGKGILFRSETDTEVISNWISYNLCNNPSITDIEQVLIKAQEELEGSWGIALVHRDHPESVFLLKNGSPILIGYQRSTGMIMVASEIAGFVNSVDRYAILEDNEVLCLHRGQAMNEIRSNLRNLRFAEVPQEIIHINPDPFPHWMAKEIYDQSEAVMGPAEWGIYQDKPFSEYPELQALFPIKERLDRYRNFDVLLVACGTSYHAGLAGRWFFRSLPFRTVRVVVASEFTDQDLPKGDDGTPKNVIAIMISQSGETKDVHRALRIIKDAYIPSIALVNVQDSLIARESDVAVYLHAGREVAVASTKAYVSQLVGLKILALALEHGKTGRITEDFKKLPDQIVQTLRYIFPYREVEKGLHAFDCPTNILSMAQALNSKNHGFVLSTGRLRAVSYEAALKIKEIGRVWVQGYPTGALKHGPFSLIERGTPVLFSLQANNQEVKKRTESAIEEVHARGAKVYLTTDISDYENKHVEKIIHLPRNETFSPVLNIIPYQALSYYISLIRGLDADHPIHLAKVVTTD